MKTILTILTLLLALASFAQLPSNVPTAGLEGWWSLDGNGKDLSGNTHDGMISGAVATEDRFGDSQGALLFDGDDEVVIPDHVDLRIGQDAEREFTISAWYYRSANANGPENVITKGQSPNTTSLIDYRIIEMGNPASTVYGMNAHITAMNLSCGNQNVGNPVTNDWHHIAFTMKASTTTNGIKKVYLDGVLIDSCSYTSKSAASSDNILIGSSGATSGAAAAYWNGKIDDIGMWSRELSSSEIYALSQDPITGLDEMETPNLSIDIYPNPTEGLVKFNLKDIDKGSIQVRNLLGQEIYSSSFSSSEFEISFADQGLSGPIMASIFTKDGQLVAVKKIIICSP